MKKLHPLDLTLKTLEHYESNPIGFWDNTKDHDVSQNITALLSHIQGKHPFQILDFGCGPGRDLKQFTDLGHDAYGLDGSESFCRMAHEYSGCKVYHQNFIDISLPSLFFDGIFANASLFHVPKTDLTSLLQVLHASLKENGIFFSSNPRGNREEFASTRYCNFMELEEYQQIVELAGFELLDHYYRPQGQAKENCPWLACVFKKK